MAKKRLYINQIFEGKNWSQYTDKTHLINAYDHDPVQIMDRMEAILDFNTGENFVSMIMKHGTHLIDPDKDIYRWRLQNTHVENYELLGAFEDEAMTRTIGTTPGYRPGANKTEFFMLFSNNPFGVNEIIVGMKPDLYRLWIAERGKNVGGDRFLYKVQLIAASQEEFIPAIELATGTRWSDDGGLAPDQLSYRGFGPRFRSHSMLENRLSQFRMEHKIPGNLMDLKINAFYVKDSKGKDRKLWISNVEFEYLKQARWAAANIVMNGRTNVWEDGTIGNVDKNGFTATTGAGFKQQWSTTNLHTWNLYPDLDELVEIALDVVVGKIDRSQRTMIVKAGEYGLRALSDMVMKKYGGSAYTPIDNNGAAWVNDGTGRAFDWKKDMNEVFVRTGQVMGIAVISGIVFKFVVDSSKDDLRRNKIMHPLGGPASSYEYDIMGFGGKDEKSNMQIVRRKGQAPIWGVEEGVRGFYKENGSFMSPKRLSTAVDASTIHYTDFGIGSIVWDPTKVVRYYPELTYV